MSRPQHSAVDPGSHSPSPSPAPSSKTYGSNSPRGTPFSLPPSNGSRRTRTRSPSAATVNSDKSNAGISKRQCTHQPTSERTKNQCRFCRQGGIIGTCVTCGSFASCFAIGSLKGCLPKWVLDEFICPPCYKSQNAVPPYPVPSYAFGSSHAGSDTGPIILYSIFLDDTLHSNTAVALLEGQLSGFFHGKENDLLTIRCAFSDFATTKRVLSGNKSKIQAFLKAHKLPSRFIFLLQTHADPDDGGLVYGPKKTLSLDMFVSKGLEGIALNDYTQFSNSLLFLNVCGGFAKHNPGVLDSTAQKFGFNTAIALTGESIDSLLVAKSLFYTVIDHHVIGEEPVLRAMERSACVDLLSITSVLLWSEGVSYIFQGAALRTRPNGRVLHCGYCSQGLAFERLLSPTSGLYRCRSKISHPAGVSKCFILPIITSDSDSTTKVEGSVNARCRYLVKVVNHSAMVPEVVECIMPGPAPPRPPKQKPVPKVVEQATQQPWPTVPLPPRPTVHLPPPLTVPPLPRLTAPLPPWPTVPLPPRPTVPLPSRPTVPLPSRPTVPLPSRPTVLLPPQPSVPLPPRLAVPLPPRPTLSLPQRPPSPTWPLKRKDREHEGEGIVKSGRLPPEQRGWWQERNERGGR